MEANGSCRACFHAETVMRRGRCGTKVNMTLSVIAARCQISPFRRCAMPDFPLSSLRASSPRSGWKSFLKGRAKSTAESLLMMPNTLATGFKPWLPPSGKLARERLRGRARLAGAAPHPALRATFPRWVKA